MRIMNINQTTANNVNNANLLDQMDQILKITNSLLALVVIIIGLSWLKPLKEKQSEASFTFWSQLRIRLFRICGHIKSNDQCLYYLYAPEARSDWDAILAPDPDKFRSLKDTVEEALTFLQNAKDQIPPYSGWTDDYTELLGHLTDIIVYDICNSIEKFKFKDPVEYSNLSRTQESICILIDSMCKKIVSKQENIEKKLTIAWYKRIKNVVVKLFCNICG